MNGETQKVAIMQKHARPGQPTPAESFPTDPSGLPKATRPALLELADGDDLHLRIGPVAKPLGDTAVRMLGYNGSIPGPSLKVRQGSEVTGYRPDYSWIGIHGVVRDGPVIHHRGATEIPCLYFLGLPWQHTRGSALPGFAHDDAAYLARPNHRQGAGYPNCCPARAPAHGVSRLATNAEPNEQQLCRLAVRDARPDVASRAPPKAVAQATQTQGVKHVTGAEMPAQPPRTATPRSRRRR
jgi:hypothetical protein